MKVIESYRVRFIPADKVCELINLWHLSRTALASQDCSRYNRLLWTSKTFHEEHNEYSVNGIYKDLSSILERY